MMADNATDEYQTYSQQEPQGSTLLHMDPADKARVDTYSRLEGNGEYRSSTDAQSPEGSAGCSQILRSAGTLWQERRFMTLAAAFVWLVLCIYTNIVLNVQASVDSNVFVSLPAAQNLTFSNRSHLVQLPDRGFKLMPDITGKLPGLPDVWLVLLGVIAPSLR